jgi:methylmalonyl-CoA/ethylmalonyl-CoA epimerase
VKERSFMQDASALRSVYDKQLHHVGLVVRDIEKAIAHFEAMGIGPFSCGDQKILTIAFEGELHGLRAEWQTKVSNARLGDVELELLEPWQGRQALSESLEATGEGLHHLGFLTEDLRGDVARQTALGQKVWTSSFRDDAPSFVYFEPSGVGELAIELRTPGVD